MTLTHKGMRISLSDWKIFIGHVGATLDHFHVPAGERQEALEFIESLLEEIVEA